MTISMHEEAILASIASGAGIDYLIGRWAVGDVTAALRHNHLIVGPDGRICPEDGRTNAVMSVLLHHDDVKIQRRAEKATELVAELVVFWRKSQDVHATAADIAHVRAGLNALIDELGALQDEAIKVTRRLKTPAAPEAAA